MVVAVTAGSLAVLAVAVLLAARAWHLPSRRVPLADRLAPHLPPRAGLAPGSRPRMR